MEESLQNLFNINESLIGKKEELRKKLFQIYFNFKITEDIKMRESDFFKNISPLINREFQKTRKKYEKLRYLTCSIDELKKEYDESPGEENLFLKTQETYCIKDKRLTPCVNPMGYQKDKRGRDQFFCTCGVCGNKKVKYLQDNIINGKE